MWKSYSLLVLAILLCITTPKIVIASMPTPIITYSSEWKVTHTTDIGFTSWEANAKDKKTELGLIPNDGVCPAETRRLFDKNNNPILDDKNKPIDVKCESAKCDGLNCYHISLTNAQMINIDDYVKIGEFSTTYEYINSTLYIYPTDTLDYEPFTVELYCNDVKLEYPDVNITSEGELGNGIKFQWEGDVYCGGKLTFRQNKLENIKCQDSFFSSSCQKEYIDYTDFEESDGNSITDSNITIITNGIMDCAEYLYVFDFDGYSRCIEEPKYYETNYYGLITDLDPELVLTFSSSSFGYYNRTEATSLGVRIETPVLFMDFNKPPEGTYVQDNSVYNNYGTTSGFDGDEFNSSCEGRTFDNDGCYEFDGTDDYIEINSPSFTNDQQGTISAWVYRSSIGSYDNIIMKGGDTGGTTFFSFRFDDSNKISVYGFGNGISTVNTYTDIQWNHVVVTSTGVTLKIYVNGAEQSITGNNLGQWFGDGSPTNPTIRIGAGEYSGAMNNPFNGSIDQVQIWDRALSASEVLELYNGSVSGYNNSDQIGKYARDGDFKSLVFYNESSIYWNTTLSLADSDGSATTYDLCQADANCVSYWDLDISNSDANPYNDEKGTNDGTPTGTNNATGISSGAMRFDGTDDYIEINSPSFISDTQGSISTWIYNTEAGDYPNIIGKGGDNTAFFTFRISNANQLTIIRSPSGGLCTTTATLSVNQWYHVALTSNGDFWNIYINGINQTLTCGGAGNNGDWFGDSPPSNPTIRIGTIEYSGGINDPFNGSIDEVLIYNKSLTPSEVEELYKAGLSQHANANVTLQTRTADSYNISDAGLVSLWSFNNDNSTTAFDETGRNNGTRQGVIADANEGNGTVGKGYWFDGVNDYVDLGNFGRNIALQSFSYTGWIKLSSVPSRAEILNIFGTYYNIQSGKLSLYINSVSSGYTQSTKTISANEWTFIATTWNGTSVSLYINDIPKTASLSGTAVGINTASRLGAQSYGGSTSFFPGAIDEVRIYNRSLSASEIQNLYELGSYHIEWNDWTDEGKMEDGMPKQSTNPGMFFQYKAVLNTNDTDVSPYVLNHSLKAFLSELTITILSPESRNYSLVDIDFNASSDLALNNCKISIDGITNYSMNIDGLNANYRIYDVPNGEYNAVFWCNSTTSLKDTDSRLFNVSAQDPSLTLLFPYHNAPAVDNYTNFVYKGITYSENVDLINATLWINGILNQSVQTIINNTIQYFNVYLNEGFYQTKVNLTDVNRHSVAREVNFSVDDNPWEINGSVVLRSNNQSFVVRYR